jgi:hypothetical protein
MLEVGLFAVDHLPQLAFPSHRRAIEDWRGRQGAADPAQARPFRPFEPPSRTP